MIITGKTGPQQLLLVLFRNNYWFFVCFIFTMYTKLFIDLKSLLELFIYNLLER